MIDGKCELSGSAFINVYHKIFELSFQEVCVMLYCWCTTVIILIDRMTISAGKVASNMSLVNKIIKK